MTSTQPESGAAAPVIPEFIQPSDAQSINWTPEMWDVTHAPVDVAPHRLGNEEGRVTLRGVAGVLAAATLVAGGAIAGTSAFGIQEIRESKISELSGVLKKATAIDKQCWLEVVADVHVQADMHVKKKINTPLGSIGLPDFTAADFYQTLDTEETAEVCSSTFVPTFEEIDTDGKSGYDTVKVSYYNMDAKFDVLVYRSNPSDDEFSGDADTVGFWKKARENLNNALPVLNDHHKIDNIEELLRAADEITAAQFVAKVCTPVAWTLATEAIATKVGDSIYNDYLRAVALAKDKELPKYDREDFVVELPPSPEFTSQYEEEFKALEGIEDLKLTLPDLEEADCKPTNSLTSSGGPN